MAMKLSILVLLVFFEATSSVQAQESVGLTELRSQLPKVEVSQETSTILQAAASEIPVVGVGVSMLVGIIFTPPDELDALREELMQYIDYSLIKQAHNDMKNEFMGMKKILKLIDQDINSEQFDEAKIRLIGLQDTMIRKNGEYETTLESGDNDAYLATYGAYAVLRARLTNTLVFIDRKENNYSAWFTNRNIEGIRDVNFTVKRAIARSVQRRVNSISALEPPLCDGMAGPYTPDNPEESCKRLHGWQFHDLRLNKTIEVNDAYYGGGKNIWSQKRMNYISEKRHEIENYWRNQILIDTCQAYQNASFFNVEQVRHNSWCWKQPLEM